MILSYIKLSLRVLMRNKFFTAISLFGISFTLAILMLLISYMQSELGDNAPLSNRDRMVIMRHALLRQMVTDSIPQVDSTLMSGVMVYDTSYMTEQRSRRSSRGPFNHIFLEEHYNDVPSTDGYTVYGGNISFNSYRNNTRVSINVQLTDANFWEIFDYQFTEGMPYDANAYKNGTQVAVVTEKFADEYYGRSSDLLQEEVILDGKAFKVIGVIKTPTSLTQDDDVFAPINSVYKENRYTSPVMGPFQCVQLASRASQVQLVKEEIDHIASQFQIPADLDYNFFGLRHGTYDEIFANMIYNDESPTKSYRILFYAITALISFFILLPVLNLISLNVGRILDRSAEIGVRKSMGASAMQIMVQFVLENVLLTLIGGAIGLVLAVILINTINGSGMLNGTTLILNWKFFLYSFLAALLFGILSGLLPAYRMSQLNIVNALKSYHL